MAVTPGERTELITTGLYRSIRHPIYALSILLVVACALVLPTAPMIAADAVRPGTHLTLVGAFTPAMAEADPRLLARAALLYADDRASVLAKGGEVYQAIHAGIIAESALRGGLADLCAAPPARTEDAITVFKAVGFAALDLIATELALA